MATRWREGFAVFGFAGGGCVSMWWYAPRREGWIWGMDGCVGGGSTGPRDSLSVEGKCHSGVDARLEREYGTMVV